MVQGCQYLAKRVSLDGRVQNYATKIIICIILQCVTTLI